ncbi:MAG: TolC family protein [Parabacteroides sp.]|nr:TolC family protein [Parabacteroides sp.]MDD6078920.1 TolC family protein [bacterium]
MVTQSMNRLYLQQRAFIKKIRQALIAASFFIPLSTHAQDTLRIDLAQALEIALTENPTIKVANQEIEKKRYAHKGTLASLFPQISYSADYSRTLKKQVMYMDFDMGDMGGMGGEMPEGMDASSMDEGFEVGRSNNWSTGITASMPLINTSLWRSLRISATDVELAVEQARSSKLSMINQVKKGFYAVLLAHDSYLVFKQSYDNAMENYLDIKRKYEQGTVAEYDLIRADVTVKNTEPNLLQAENALVLAKWQLKALLGMDLEMPIDCEGALGDYRGLLFADYMATDTTLAANSDLRQLDLQQQQLRHTLTMQKLDFLPTLSLSGLYQWSAMNNDFKFKNYRWNPYSMIGLSLSIPIFTGGSRYMKIKQTEISLKQLDWQRDDTQRNLRLAVKQQLDNMSTCVKRFDAASKGIDQAERGYRIAQKRYDTGAGTWLEMNDAELALTQARLNFNQAIYDYMVAKTDLEKTLGNEE